MAVKTEREKTAIKTVSIQNLETIKLMAIVPLPYLAHLHLYILRTDSAQWRTEAAAATVR